MSADATGTNVAKLNLYVQVICGKHPQGDHTTSCFMLLSCMQDITPRKVAT